MSGYTLTKEEKIEEIIDYFCKKLADNMRWTFEQIPVYGFIEKLGSYCNNEAIEDKLGSIDCELDEIKDKLTELVEVLKYTNKILVTK